MTLPQAAPTNERELIDALEGCADLFSGTKDLELSQNRVGNFENCPFNQ